METIIQWLLSLMLLAMPPGRYSHIPEAKETREDGLDRYQQIATAIASVAYDVDEYPLFPGERGRESTAAMLLAVSYIESGWRRDIDLGEGRARLARQYGTNDRGSSWCMMQIHLGKRGEDSARVTARGWHGRELLEDREKCFRAGLDMLRLHINQCRRYPQEAWLRSYVSGSCRKAAYESQVRMATYQRWWRRSPAVPDSLVLFSDQLMPLADGG